MADPKQHDSQRKKGTNLRQQQQIQEGPRNKTAAPFLLKQGQLEPYLKRAMQLGGHWQIMANKGYLSGETYQEYWEAVRMHNGTPQGPIHLMAKLM